MIRKREVGIKQKESGCHLCGAPAFRVDPEGKIWCYKHLHSVTTKVERKAHGLKFSDHLRTLFNRKNKPQT